MNTWNGVQNTDPGWPTFFSEFSEPVQAGSREKTPFQTPGKAGRVLGTKFSDLIQAGVAFFTQFKVLGEAGSVLGNEFSDLIHAGEVL